MDNTKELTKNGAQDLSPANGRNGLREKKPKTYVQMFLAQLTEPMIYILLIAMAVSIWEHSVGDAFVILAVILLNAIIG
ncbi:cation-transporting P-type ATPase, partial [Treponema sp. R6D11]